MQLNFDNIGITRSADFSSCGKYRYTLIREWDDRPRLLMILLNPSTADAYKDDPTNRRGLDFAIRWGYGSLCFCNLFAYRTPYPNEMLRCHDPIGKDNDKHILDQIKISKMVIAGWGNDGKYLYRDLQVLSLFDNWYCLGKTKSGMPKHPLYLRKDVKPKKYNP